MTAVSMPGSRRSIVYCWRPFDLGSESYRGSASLPMYFQSFGSFRLTSVGTGPLAAPRGECAICRQLAGSVAHNAALRL